MFDQRRQSESEARERLYGTKVLASLVYCHSGCATRRLPRSSAGRCMIMKLCTSCSFPTFDSADTVSSELELHPISLRRVCSRPRAQGCAARTFSFRKQDDFGSGGPGRGHFGNPSAFSTRMHARTGAVWSYKGKHR